MSVRSDNISCLERKVGGTVEGSFATATDGRLAIHRINMPSDTVLDVMLKIISTITKYNHASTSVNNQLGYI